MSDESGEPASSHSVIAPATAAGQRVDRFLAEAIGTLSRSRVKALIEAGHCQSLTMRAC